MKDTFLNSFQTIVVTASVKEGEMETKVTLLQDYCISLPRDSAL
jgi:hypothetical protein